MALQDNKVGIISIIIILLSAFFFLFFYGNLNKVEEWSTTTWGNAFQNSGHDVLRISDQGQGILNLIFWVFTIFIYPIFYIIIMVFLFGKLGGKYGLDDANIDSSIKSNIKIWLTLLFTAILLGTLTLACLKSPWLSNITLSMIHKSILFILGCVAFSFIIMLLTSIYSNPISTQVGSVPGEEPSQIMMNISSYFTIVLGGVILGFKYLQNKYYNEIKAASPSKAKEIDGYTYDKIPLIGNTHDEINWNLKLPAWNMFIAIIIIILWVSSLFTYVHTDPTNEITETILRNYNDPVAMKDIRGGIDVFFEVIIIALILWMFVMIPMLKDSNKNAIESLVEFIESIQKWQIKGIIDDKPDQKPLYDNLGSIFTYGVISLLLGLWTFFTLDKPGNYVFGIILFIILGILGIVAIHSCINSTGAIKNIVLILIPILIILSSWGGATDLYLHHSDTWSVQNKNLIVFFICFALYVGLSALIAPIGNLLRSEKGFFYDEFKDSSWFANFFRWIFSTAWLYIFTIFSFFKWIFAFVLFIIPYLLYKLYKYFIQKFSPENNTNVNTTNDIVKEYFVDKFESRIFKFPDRESYPYFNIPETNILRQIFNLSWFLNTETKTDSKDSDKGVGKGYVDLQLFMDSFSKLKASADAATPPAAAAAPAAAATNEIETIEERKTSMMRKILYIIGMFVSVAIFIIIAVYGGYKSFGIKTDGDGKEEVIQMAQDKFTNMGNIAIYSIISLFILVAIIAFYRYKIKETGGEDKFSILEQPLDTKNDGIFMMILKYIWSTIRLIPCLIVDAIDAIRREFNITTRPIWIILIVEFIIILLAWLIPFLMNKIGTASDSQIVAGSVPLNQERDTGLKTDSPEVAIFNNTGKDRSDSDNAANCPPEEKKRYSYSVSGWFWINGGANTEDKDLMILNFGNVPRITYNPASTNFKVECDQILPNGETTERDFTSGNVDANSGVKPAIVYQSLEISNIDKKSTDYKEYEMINAIQIQKLIQLQKWNYIVINYDGKTMDVFLNSELIGKSGFIMPNIRSDIIKTGQKDGLSGNICNVVCAHEPMTTEKMRWTYNTLKMLDPPIIGADSVVDDINNLRNTEYTSRYFNQGQVNERK